MKNNKQRKLIASQITLCMYVFALLFSSPAKTEDMRAADYSQTINYLKKLIRGEMKKNKINGLSIALVDDGNVVISGGFGYADAGKKLPATDETIYGIGSITKIFTATAVMQLAERKHMDLNAPLSRYVPEFAMKTRFSHASPVTLKNLLTHHSGLPGDYLKGMWTLHPGTFKDIFSVLRQEYVSYPPDYVYSYSTLGYAFLGELIQRVSERSYEDYMKENIFAPMGMDHTSFHPVPEYAHLQAAGYRKGEPGAEKYFIRETAGGGMFSSVRDMSSFIMMLLGTGRINFAEILHEDSIGRMWQRQNAGVINDMDFEMGLGWMLGNSELDYAGRVLHHSGGTLGTAGELMLLPDYKLGVIILSNSPESSALLTRIAVESLKRILQDKTGMKKSAVSEKQPPETVELSREKLTEYTGNYASNFYTVFRVFLKGRNLLTDFQGKTFALLPYSGRKFGLQYRMFGRIPVKIPGLDTVFISVHDVADRRLIALEYSGKRYPLAVRIESKPVPEIWLKRAGKYEIANKGEDGTLIENLELIYEHDILIFKYTLPEAPGFTFRIALDPISDTEAVSCGLGRFLGETFRAAAVDGKSGLIYSGYMLRRMEP